MALWCLLVGGLVSIAAGSSPPRSFTSTNLINNVVRDPASGRVYVGAVNWLYQLDASLTLERHRETGPHKDSPHCTPPITSACPDPKETHNHNKLLLVHPTNGSLVVCGSLYRGICSLVNLTDVQQTLYYSDSKGEKTYVASTEEDVSVVGVLSTYTSPDQHRLDVFLVAKGYGPADGSKLISTRTLEEHADWVVFENIVEASTVQAGSFVQRYLHHFRHAFNESGYIYFLFSRTAGLGDKANFTFIARLCENDRHYYSYTELQLNCSHNNQYNKIQAAYVAPAGAELARHLTASGEHGEVIAGDQVLYGVFSSDEDSVGTSALCMYPLKSINRALKRVVSACYNNKGLIDGKVAVYLPYDTKERNHCEQQGDYQQKDLADIYQCGDEFLPSPLAGKAEFALPTTESFVRSGMFTAVSVAVETDHTVAFLGTKGGEVLKVHLTDAPYYYGCVPGDNTPSLMTFNL
ncbi:plexin-B2-like [Engraulis encrasicolus]|uniref:plexin-B2-like n=1 Tax=Engraulis encrasicolus TaxID=184585 RepID=UPI002FD23334